MKSMATTTITNRGYTEADFQKIGNPFFKEGDTCVICQEPHTEHTRQKVELVCKHVFCTTCFLQIPQKSNGSKPCAMCRSEDGPNRYFSKESGILNIGLDQQRVSTTLTQALSASVPAFRMSQATSHRSFNVTDLRQLRQARDSTGLSLDHYLLNRDDTEIILRALRTDNPRLQRIPSRLPNPSVNATYQENETRQSETTQPSSNTLQNEHFMNTILSGIPELLNPSTSLQNLHPLNATFTRLPDSLGSLTHLSGLDLTTLPNTSNQQSTVEDTPSQNVVFPSDSDDEDI